jgi:hypothetical protein
MFPTGELAGLVVSMESVILYTVFEMQAKAAEAKRSEMQHILLCDDVDDK